MGIPTILASTVAVLVATPSVNTPQSLSIYQQRSRLADRLDAVGELLDQNIGDPAPSILAQWNNWGNASSPWSNWRNW
ncbi:hypothetical protein GGE65_008212 [Skermanella aerolata]